MSFGSRISSDMVPLALLRRYLTAQGWHLAEPPTPPRSVLELAASSDEIASSFFKGRSAGKRNVEVFVLSEPGQENIQLIVPRNRESSDFERRLQGAVETLSQVEDRAPEEIVASVRAVGIDVVITISPAEYLKAVEAHRLGRAVRVSGTLVHRGRYWYLNDPSSLSVPQQFELGLN